MLVNFKRLIHLQKCANKAFFVYMLENSLVSFGPPAFSQHGKGLCSPHAVPLKLGLRIINCSVGVPGEITILERWLSTGLDWDVKLALSFSANSGPPPYLLTGCECEWSYHCVVCIRDYIRVSGIRAKFVFLIHQFVRPMR